MAKQTSIFATRNSFTAGVSIAYNVTSPTDETGWRAVYTAASDDAVIKGLSAVSSDTAAINLRIGIDVGGTGTVYQIACVNIPIAAGNAGAVNAIDLLNASALPFLPVDRNGKRILPLKGGDILKVACLAAMTAGAITVTALGEEY